MKKAITAAVISLSILSTIGVARANAAYDQCMQLARAAFFECQLTKPYNVCKAEYDAAAAKCKQKE